jgi:hypothetical protein
LDDCGNSVQCSSDGGYVITGKTLSFDAGGGDVYLIKTDKSGNMQWSNTFGDSEHQEQGFCVRQTSDGRYVIAGTSSDLSDLDEDACLVKTNADGNQEWYKIFGGDDRDGGTGVQQTGDGYVLCGYTHSFGALDFNAWLIKTDASGSRQWDQTFGGNAWDQAEAVQQTSDGGYVMAGMTRSDVPWEQAWLIKTDADGMLEWSKTFGGDGLGAVCSTDR